MADFEFLSDTDDSAVEELISQAQDLCVLEQLSAINSSVFSYSALPTDLETRFRSLLSKPKTVHGSFSDGNPKIFSLKQEHSVGKDNKSYPHGKFRPQKESPFDSSTGENIFSSMEENPDGEKGLKKISQSQHLPSDSSNSWTENFISSPSEHKSEKSRSCGSKLKYGSFTSPLSSSTSSMDSPSPPQKTGCFWCSPKRVPKKKNEENRNIDWGNKNDEFLSDLHMFASKEQQKMLKKAMKEEVKISREAEKIVKWAKQASDRMNFHGIEEELSDNDEAKFQ